MGVVVMVGVVAVRWGRVAFGRPEAICNPAHELVLVGIQGVFVVKNIRIRGCPRRHALVGTVPSLHGWLVGGPSSPSGPESPEWPPRTAAAWSLAQGAARGG